MPAQTLVRAGASSSAMSLASIASNRPSPGSSKASPRARTRRGRPPVPPLRLEVTTTAVAAVAGRRRMAGLSGNGWVRLGVSSLSLSLEDAGYGVVDCRPEVRSTGVWPEIRR